MHGSKYMTNTNNLRVVVGCRVLQFTLVDLKAAWYITLRHTRVTTAALEHVSLYMSLYLSLYMIMAIK